MQTGKCSLKLHCNIKGKEIAGKLASFGSVGTNLDGIESVKRILFLESITGRSNRS